MSESRDKLFARECLKLEKAGGDVLDYIAKEYPSYTPRPVWYRLQKKYLGRSPRQLTEGKPESKKGDEDIDMGRAMEIVQEARAAHAKGENLYEFLIKKGYDNPSATWYWMKETVSKKDMELYEWMTTVRIRQKKLKLEEGFQAEVKAEKPEEKPEKKEIQKAGDPLPIKLEPKKPEGQNAEAKVADEVESYGASPTCCQPARPSGVTVPDEIPEETKRDDAFKKVAEAMKKLAYIGKPDPEPMEVIGVRSRVKGHYMKSEVVPGIGDDVGYVHLIWRDIRTMEERSLGLGVDEWLRLAEEIPKALKALGF